jgi:hypothetical protein
MEIYLIIALSFTIMYWWSYTREIILTVKGVENRFDKMDGSINPVIFSILSGVATFVAMPVYAYCILTIPRRAYIKDIATTIVKKQHEIANEN